MNLPQNNKPEDSYPRVTLTVSHGFVLMWMGDVKGKVERGQAPESDFHFQGEEARKMLKFLSIEEMGMLRQKQPIVTRSIPGKYFRIAEKMKVSELKSIVKEVVREAMTTRAELDTGLMKAVNVEATENKPWTLIDQRFYKVSGEFAKKIAGGKLPGIGMEKLIPAPSGFPTKSGHVWLTLTKTRGNVVWSIRDAGNWKLENGLAVLSGLDVLGRDEEKINEMSTTGAVAGYQTPFAFTKNKKGSPRAIAAAKKYGTVVGDAPRV